MVTLNGLRYLARRLDCRAEPAALRKDALEFNSAFGPGMVLSVDGDGATLHMRSARPQDLDLLERRLACGGLAAQIISAVEGVKSYGYSNGKKQFVDYDAERKTKDRARKSGARLGAREAARAQAGNEVPRELQNAMICGDSRRELKRIPDNSVDMIFTSPPYNFGLDYSDGDDAQSWDLYFEDLFGVLDECVRVLKHGGRLVVNVQPLFSDYIPTHHRVSEHVSRQPGMMWKGEILWEKNNYNCKYTAWGSWKSPSSPYLKYTWEFVEVFCKGDLKKDGRKEDADISADDFKKWVYAKWSIGPERSMKKYGHPAMFPEELARRALQLFSFKNDLVLDPFMGVGTTCCVARRLGRRYLGIDISEDYVRAAKARISEQLP